MEMEEIMIQRATPPALSRGRLDMRRSSAKSPRITTHLVAEGRVKSRQVVGWLLDLSSTGLFFRHAEPFELGERISLEFYLPEAGTVIRCLAVVTSKVEGGKLWPAGNRLTFWVMRPAHVAAIDVFIQTKLAKSRAANQPKIIEESLISGTLPVSYLDGAPKSCQAISVEALPEVGAWLEEIGGDEGFEVLNDVGFIRPEDLIPLH